MKLNLSAIALASMALGVAAVPAQDNAKPHNAAARKIRGVVGDLVMGEKRDENARRADSYYGWPGSYPKVEQAAKTTGGSKPTSTGGASGPSPTATGSGSGGSGSMPDAAGSSVLSAVKTIAAGQSFDGGNKIYDRGVSCEVAEGGEPVFVLEEGASISNVIIGPNQIDGIHCYGGCTIENVWWTDVCEDAFTIKEQAEGDTTNVIGGGAKGGPDKILQHNGGGTMSVSGFTVEDFGKLYRSCGNCKSQYARHVIISDVTATNGDLIAGVNSNYGDTAKISGVQASGVAEICQQFTGNSNGDEPTKGAAGNDGKVCIIN